MKNRILTWKDCSVTGLLIVSLAVLMYPWQIILIDMTHNKYFRLLFEVVGTLSILYVFVRARHFSKKLKWIIRIITIPSIVYGLLIIFGSIIVAPPKQTTYATFYSNPHDSFQVIKVWHNHGFAHNWNEVKHVIELAGWGFRLEKDFDLANLQGEWYVHPGNPYHDVEGMANFENGKEIK